jgi:uncharacterized metal-binding protein YceD (DUF177 family)
MQTVTLPVSVIRLGPETPRKDIAIALRPDTAACAALAADLAIPGLRKVSLTGTLAPVGRRDWRLTARFGATFVQDCIVTLVPVTTRVDEDLTRIYAADVTPPGMGEVEMPDDTDTEPLPASLDLMEVLAEALSLALPPFPRAPGVAFDGVEVTEPGAIPLGDDGAKPFAALAALKDQKPH